MAAPLIVGLLIIVVIGVGGIAYVTRLVMEKRRFMNQLQLKLLLVQLTSYGKKERGEGEKKESELQEIGLTEQLISALTSFKKTFILEIAVPHVGEEIHFFISVPGSIVQAVERQIQALWNNADVREVEEYNIFNANGVVKGGWVKQKERYALPVRTYREVNGDTFLPFVGAFTKINAIGEGAAMQLVIKPASSSTKQVIKSILEGLKKGESLDESMKSPMKTVIGELLEVFLGRKAKEKEKENKEPKTIDEPAVKALEMKLSKPLLEVNIRMLASASGDEQAQAIFEGMIAGFSQFTAPERNEFKIIQTKNVKKLAYQFSFREWNDDQVIIVNTEELASMYHLPTHAMDVPKIKYLRAREAPPPPNLPNEGVVVGESIYRGEVKQVRITDDDRRRHVYVIGQTGTGKSNLQTNMAIDDIRAGKGVGVIDPHGDLVDTILGLMPKERYEDVIVFNPADIECPLGLNMIEYNPTRPEEKTFIVNEMQGIFNKLFSQETMGPMFEQYMRNALLLLMEDAENHPATLMEVPKVFTDDDYREEKLERIHNPTVIDFWEKEAVRAGGEAALSNMTPYITSKFNNFTANDYMRPIIGQVKSAFSFREVMDEGKILLIKLSKGKIGDINANLLGMIIVGKLLMAALGRVDMPQDKRRDFNLYIDEFQNFTTDSIAVILSEARKYRLNLTIAHQFIAQLTEKVRDAVFGNVGSLVSFRVGAQDTEVLVKQLSPTFNEYDLMNIANGNAYVKLLIKGETSAPFNIRTILAKKGDAEVAASLAELSRLKYGADRKEIEEEIFERLRE